MPRSSTSPLPVFKESRESGPNVTGLLLSTLEYSDFCLNMKKSKKCAKKHNFNVGEKEAFFSHMDFKKMLNFAGLWCPNQIFVGNQ